VSRFSRFSRTRDGALVVHMATEEIEVLRQLATELGQLLNDPSIDDAVATRLFPRAYLDPTEEQTEEDWQRLVHPELVSSRLAALQLLVDTLPAVSGNDPEWIEARLDAEAEAAWLGVLNDARLALGTRLGVTEDDDFSALAPDEPDFYARQVYLWLSALQEELVQALLATLPDASDE
jgi:hypothetical protein